jgi:hypothetical protein
MLDIPPTKYGDVITRILRYWVIVPQNTSVLIMYAAFQALSILIFLYKQIDEKKYYLTKKFFLILSATFT